MNCLFCLLVLVAEPPQPNPEKAVEAAKIELESKGARVSIRATASSVSLSARATDKDMWHVAAIPNVHMLTCMSKHITDDGMLAIANMPISFLMLYSRKITDEGLGHLSGQALTSIDVHQTSVTAGGLEFLKDCTKLSSVGVNQAQLTDASVEYFQNVKSIRLHGDKITGKDIARVIELEYCTTFYVMALDVEGLELLGDSRIETLGFGNTNLLPAQVEELQQMVWLKKLTFFQSPLDDAVLDAIVLSLPDTEVTVR